MGIPTYRAPPWVLAVVVVEASNVTHQSLVEQACRWRQDTDHLYRLPSGYTDDNGLYLHALAPRVFLGRNAPYRQSAGFQTYGAQPRPPQDDWYRGIPHPSASPDWRAVGLEAEMLVSHLIG